MVAWLRPWQRSPSPTASRGRRRGGSLDRSCALHRRRRPWPPHSLLARASPERLSRVRGGERGGRAFLPGRPPLFSVPFRPIRESVCRLHSARIVVEAFCRAATRSGPELRHQAQSSRASCGEKGACHACRAHHQRARLDLFVTFGQGFGVVAGLPQPPSARRALDGGDAVPEPRGHGILRAASVAREGHATANPRLGHRC